MKHGDPMVVDVGRALRPMPGESACGDRIVVVDEGVANLVVGVVDGLGHGPAAAAAAEAATRFLSDNASLPLGELFRECHRSIKHTRGVAMTVVRVDRGRRIMSHAAVGNVELWAVSENPVAPVADPGVVGGRVRRVRESRFEIVAGDVFAVFSDGISTRMDLRAYGRLGAQSMAEAILRDHAKDHDDASCAVLVC